MHGGPALDKRTADIIVTVYNAPGYLRRCLASVYKHTSPDLFNIVIVDDGSDEVTGQVIAEYKTKHSNFLAVRNNSNLGRVKSLHTALKHSVSENLVLLDTDTMVTDRWLEKFLEALERDARIGLISPLTNNLSGANLEMKMPPGFDFLHMNEFLEHNSRRVYPDALTVCGFCLLVRRDVVDAIGWFDPIFSPGYGEESDYHLRAVTSGFRAVVADDTYVYHRGETSFKSRTELLAERLKIFSRRWSGEYDRLLAEYERRDELGYLRDRQTTMPLFEKYSYVPTYDVVFILPGLRSRIGGIYTVAEIVNALVESGKHANVGYFGEKNLDADLLFEPIRYSDNEELLAFPPPTKVLVATEYRTVYPVARVHESCGTSPVYFIQDYEGWFEPLSLLSVVKATYGRIDRRIAISRWVHDMIEQEDGYESTVIEVGVADDDFYKRNKIPVELEDLRRNHKILVFASLIGYERRGSAYFIQAMKELLSTTRDIAFVVTQSPDKRLLDLSDPRIVNVGLIDRSQMPAYLSACDIIVDASLYHGFGLPALEGMSCGLAAVMTDVQIEYARNGLNCILIEPRSVKQLKGAILRLRDDPELLSRMKEEARKTAVEYSWRNLFPRYEAYFEELLRSVREPPLPLYYDYGKLLARYAFRPHGGKDSPVAFPVDPLPSPSEMLRRFSVYAKRDGVKAALKFAFGWLFK